ncbi:MAG: helix-turn-helix domain-containing protein [Rhodospirillales bacterium]|nr:helix-turn-helix domain-containing protein [Rhodospirillales bacterium]
MARSTGFYSHNIEAQMLKSALTNTEYVLRGGRSHLFVLNAGSLLSVLADTETLLTAPCFLWVPQGLSSSIKLAAGTRGSMISVPATHLGTSIPDSSIGNTTREAIGYPIIGRDPAASLVKKLQGLQDTIFAELVANDLAAQSVIRYSLTLLVIELWRASQPTLGTTKPLPRTIVQNFMSLADLHLADHWTVQAYANEIGVTKDRLTTAVRRSTGRSPLAEIHRKLIREAELLLANSGLQVSEIGYKLGFRDAAYFSRFFNRNTGISPNRFRQQRTTRAADNSFAAWP